MADDVAGLVKRKGESYEQKLHPGRSSLCLTRGQYIPGQHGNRQKTAAPAKTIRTAFEQINALPEPQRGEALDVIKKYRPQIKERLLALSQLRKETYTYLASKDYDHAKVEDYFKKLRDQTADVQQLIQSMTVALADKLPPEQRA